jgi:hypothetical protein
MIETNVPMVSATANIFFSRELFVSYIKVKLNVEMILSAEKRNHFTKFHLKSFWI